MSEQSKIDAERAAFEAWYLQKFFEGDKQCGIEWLSTEPCGGYRYAEQAHAWLIWQARASLQVGVPDVSELQRLLDDVRDVRSADDVAFGWYEAVERMLAAAPTVKSEQPDMVDAYVGAREDLTVWKRRALEAEAKVRHQEQIIDHLTLEAQGETRFGEPSMPSAEPVAVIEYAGYDPANSIKWLNKGLQYMEPGTLLYAQAPSLPAAGSADQPYPDGIAEDLERSDWTPLEAIQWYAAGKHFDVVEGRTRIIDTGAVASNALKHASLDYLELKGDAELSELRAAINAMAAGSAVEEVEVVGYRWKSSIHTAPDLTPYAPASTFAPGYDYVEPLMTVAQHNRIVAALRVQIAERDAAIEEWSGTAVQNGMEVDRLTAALSAQQSAPERVSVLCEALEDARRAMFAVLNQEPRMKAVAKRVLNAEIGRIDRALLASHGRGEA